MKKSYSKQFVSNLVFALVLVSAFFIISFILNFFGGFSVRIPERFDLMLGEDAVINMQNYGSQSISLQFSGKSLPGQTIMQNVQVKLPNLDLSNHTVRIKAYVGDGASFQMAELGGFDFWEHNEEDGYYYFLDDITSLQEIGICTFVVLPQNISLNPNFVYSFIVSSELVGV